MEKLIVTKSHVTLSALMAAFQPLATLHIRLRRTFSLCTSFNRRTLQPTTSLAKSWLPRRKVCQYHWRQEGRDKVTIRIHKKEPSLMCMCFFLDAMHGDAEVGGVEFIEHTA